MRIGNYKRKLPEWDVVVDLYVNQQKNLAEICRMHGLSEGSKSNISRKLRQMGIEIRQDKGTNHHAWSGGRIVKGDGYVGVWNPRHERADKQGYVYEHTLVVEEALGRLPGENEVVHHINLDKQDNTPSNLWVCGNKEHIVCHRSVEKLIKPLLEHGVIEFVDGAYRIVEEGE